MQAARAGFACAALFAAATAAPATLDSIDVAREHGIYSFHAEARLDVSPEAVFAVLVDYDHIGRISGVYKEYGYLTPAADGTPIVYTRMEGCLLIYCKSLTRVERLETEAPGHIRTVVLPEQSDFKRSVSDWRIEREGSLTRVTYTLEMEPDFFVPPVIGPWYLKRTLLRGGGNALDRIERLAIEIDEAREQDPARRIDEAREGG